MRQVRTACPLDCWDCCSMIAFVENGKVVKVEGDPDHPITRGRLCIKGKQLVDRMYHPERILTPKKKVDGQWIDISWDQAFQEIADKMLKAKARYGPTSVMHTFDSGSGGMLKELEGRFFNLFGGYSKAVGSLCWEAGLEAGRYDMGACLSHDPTDHANSKGIVVWGRNVTVTNMHVTPFLKAARKKGARLAIINPLPTDLSESADLQVYPRPGTDGALALAVCRILLETERYDREFVEKNAVGFEEFAAYLRELSVEELCAASEVAVEDVCSLADFYSDRPVTTLLGLGMQRYANGGNTMRAINAVAAMSGNIGVRGGGVNYANRIWSKWLDWDALTLEGQRKEYREISKVEQAEQILQADPPVEVLFVTRSNPVAQVGNRKRTIEAYQSVDCVVLFDMFLHDTAEVADYFLPCTSVFEEEDILYSSMWHPYLIYVNQCVEPLGNAKRDWEIFAGLADRLGFGGEFRRGLHEWMRTALAPLEETGLTLERLQREHFAPAPSAAVPWHDRRFATQSGKYEFYSQTALEEGHSAFPMYLLPWEHPYHNPDLAEKYPYQLLTIHPRHSLNAQHYILKRPDSPVIEISKEIAREKGLQDGDLVRVFNERGELMGRTRIQEKMHPGTVMVEQGWWNQMGVSVNDLTPDRPADFGISIAVYDCLCNIEKA
ncbi:molybdopterin-containing oxidoreductase family protein [Effusibacillus lacus]|uniref:Oxidoreductase n=1 Tax=Effusibacillus lacus TaxID=1348429 RepID=A0A292YCH0_9BACL|nr:molybdopterin-dependent oxidoreductase [Effusibacillus lacus]TCS75177.1 anaerobic selenocysteine-containing dehydrogenase [Effusibacillus lacus]GAX89122.1 oxidoreductase [Effusibacillus lacus]